MLKLKSFDMANGALYAQGCEVGVPHVHRLDDAYGASDGCEATSALLCLE